MDRRLNVKLISITPDAEKIIAHIARVSSPDNQSNPEFAKLIRYLIIHKHYSPFEHAYLTFEVTTSMAIGEQILRHRSMTFQKFSGRYSEFTVFEPIELRKQAIKNRQSSTDIIDDPFLQDLVQKALDVSKGVYQVLIEAGIAREVARFVLPAATQTTMYLTGNVRSFMHYLELRDDEHTQKEHQLIAKEIKRIFIEQLPIISEALGWTNEAKTTTTTK